VTESKIKVGDKYAVIVHQSVEGPFYVTSVRGTLVSLDKDPAPDPKAKRTWRAWGFEGRKDLHSMVPYSTVSAEPWTKAHEDTMERNRLVRHMTWTCEVAAKTKFANLANQDLKHLMELLGPALPKEKT